MKVALEHSISGRMLQMVHTRTMKVSGKVSDAKVSPFVRGMLEFVPLLPAAIPFGLVVGVAQVQAGLTVLESVGMSVLGYAGSAQLVASQMVQGGAPLLLILLAVATVNLRFAMYSAVLRERFREFSKVGRALNGFLLTDQTFALFVDKLERIEPRARLSYTLGAGLSMYMVWQICTLLGALLGQTLPRAWSLDFAVTLTFVALGVPAVKDRPTLAAACAGGLAAVLTAELPYKLGLMVGTGVGLVVGMIAMRVYRNSGTRAKH